jgi:glycopeptide antibiotics resistance protein
MTKHGDILSNIDFQIMFQVTYFVIVSPWAVMYTVKNTPPITSESLTMYFFIAFGLQLYMFNKKYILNSPRSIIPANILLSGLDLIRRVIQLTYSFVWFNEPFDAVIALSLVFLGTSAGLLLYQYISDYYYRSGSHSLGLPGSELRLRRHHILHDDDNDDTSDTDNTDTGRKVDEQSAIV